MSILETVISRFKRSPQNQHNFIGAPSFSVKNPAMSFLDCYMTDKYASIYPSVKAITNDFKVIRPYAIDANGKKVENNAVINALYHPNQIDSSVAFREKLAVMNLTHRKTYILVWRREGIEAKPGGELRADNIAGFTFLEMPGITRRDGRTYYNIGSQEFSDKEVMVIPGGVDPADLYAGYAAGEASRRWATLDEYIADYQKGFFENGTVPSGQFVITAASQKDFDDTVDMMEARHRGVGKNNNVTFVMRPVNQTDGKPMNAKIEWIPYATPNKDIDFKNIFDQANKRIDSSFGVPASIRGVGENNNYATARLDQQNFVTRAVNPLALSIYTQITHELNRITGGLGIAITYDLEIPAIAEEEKVIAETKQINVNMITQLIDKGYSLESAVDALELPAHYKKLKLGDNASGTGVEDKPEVDEGDEVDDSPDPEKIDGITPVNSGKKKKKKWASNEETDYDKIYDVAKETMQRQIDKAVDELSEDDLAPSNEVKPDPTLDEENQFVDDMMAVIIPIMLAAGLLQYDVGKELLDNADIDTDGLTEFSITDTAETRYRQYLNKVATSYMGDTAESIRAVLARGVSEELNLAETKDALKKIIGSDDYRIRRMAETELNRSQAVGSIESMIEIKNQTGAEIEKGLMHNGGDAPCEFCAVLLNRWVIVEQEFIPEGEVITGADGGQYINSFAPNFGYDIHPNGHCSPEYRIAGSASNYRQAIINQQKKQIEELSAELKDMDGRTKEAKDLKKQVEDLNEYIVQLESIIDGQG